MYIYIYHNSYLHVYLYIIYTYIYIYVCVYNIRKLPFFPVPAALGQRAQVLHLLPRRVARIARVTQVRLAAEAAHQVKIQTAWLLAVLAEGETLDVSSINYTTMQILQLTAGQGVFK